MAGYVIHLASVGDASNENTPREKTLREQAFTLGVIAPDILKKWNSLYGSEGACQKYESLRIGDAPGYHELAARVVQKERPGSTDGLHYGVSSSPDVRAFWTSLSESQKETSFYRGYLFHLLTDYIFYKRININEKFAAFSKQKEESLTPEESLTEARNLLHADWDKLNARVKAKYPDVVLPEAVLELGLVKFLEEGELTFVDEEVVMNTIQYLRSFDLINGNMEAIIEEVLNCD